jgi:hypothetical protein
VIGMLALHTGIAPRELWEADPRDLATLIDLTTAKKTRRRR